jgi:anti-sigma regulatory factor (Ser/Thr protein kinase)
MSLWRPPSDLSENGRGLLIASALAEDFSIHPEDRGTGCCIEVVLPAQRPLGEAA